MDSSQIIIKSVLIAVFVIAAIVIIIPGRGARGQAIQRLVMLLTFLAGILAIVFPEVTTTVANFLGIGRGVDLLLYLLIIVFIGYVLSTQIRLRKDDRALTILARRIALLEVHGREGHDTLEDVEADAGERK